MTGITMVRLVSSDNVEIQVPRDVAERSVLIKNIVGDLGEEALVDAIPISNVPSKNVNPPLLQPANHASRSPSRSSRRSSIG